ncbi:MAG: asparaginase [Balneolaceae bacterium]|nr:MAG: asparaginase [Balneolaceae bacterium]
MKKILLLQTGGTISMHFDQHGSRLDPEKWTEVLYREVPELEKIALIDIQNLFFEDSSDLNQKHWISLSSRIYEQLSDYDGFVILHGTDTMAYTASALSFALPGLSKPVILTGSQVPMSKIRSDARRNLINAVELATCNVPEVAICFNDHLYRGNRSTKMSINDFDAFASPNHPPLAEIGIKINLSEKVLQSGTLTPQHQPFFDNSLYVIRLYPNLNPSFLNEILLNPLNAVIIEAFGHGNVPSRGELSLLPFIQRCRDRKCHVIITTQAPFDEVDLDLYEGSRRIRDMGALSAGGMTMEATVTKTMHLLGKEWPEPDFRELFMRNLCGER